MSIKETAIVGDVHGCIEELLSLLKIINYRANKMNLVFLGDLGDRGPNSVECVKLVRALCNEGAKCVLGNHEARHIRYRGHEITKSLTGKSNPMRPMNPLDAEAHKKFTNEDIAWMRNLPLKIELKSNWYAIHGGLESLYGFHNQSPEQIIRCRYVSNGNYTTSKGKNIPRGRAVALNKDNTQPHNTIYWADIWDGKESIVFGHYVFDNPTTFKNKNNTCVGIDTGCVFGGFLTAFFLEQNEFVKIKAKREYAQLKAITDEH